MAWFFTSEIVGNSHSIPGEDAKHISKSPRMKAGEKYFNDHGIDSFEIGTVIKNSGHLVAYYNDDQIHRITVEGCTFTTAANIALIDDSYTIGVTGEYLGLLENALAKKEDIV